MTDFDDTAPDGPLTPEQEAQARLLTATDLRRIDECLLSNTSQQWRKVARVVAITMQTVGDKFPGIPAEFYSLRIKRLADTGAIEAAGDLNRMRYSEIRIPALEQNAKSQKPTGRFVCLKAAIRERIARR